VGITVSVDDKGKVSKSVLDSDSSGINPFLTNLSLKAAKDWLFKPATHDGHPVTGEFHIDFVFQPAVQGK
jgi:hypothetical protein